MLAAILPVALLSLVTFTNAQAGPTYVTGTALPPSITTAAGGSVPSLASYPTLSDNGKNLMQLALYLENAQSHFYQQGVYNYSNWDKSSTNGVDNYAMVQSAAAQSEVQVSLLTQILLANKVADVAPCKYVFPTVDESSFIALANILVNIQLGVLMDLADALSASDPTLQIIITQMITVIARHDAYFRTASGEQPNPTSYGTRVDLTWAYNLILGFVEYGSCYNLPPYITSLPIWPELSISGSGVASYATPNAPGKLIFKVLQAQLLPQGWNQKPLWISWVNQMNAPVYTPVTVQGDELHADVNPGMFGMVYAVLTDQNTATTIADLTVHVLAGPLPLPFT